MFTRASGSTSTDLRNSWHVLRCCRWCRNSLVRRIWATTRPAYVACASGACEKSIGRTRKSSCCFFRFLNFVERAQSFLKCGQVDKHAWPPTSNKGLQSRWLGCGRFWSALSRGLHRIVATWGIGAVVLQIVLCPEKIVSNI